VLHLLTPQGVGDWRENEMLMPIAKGLTQALLAFFALFPEVK